MKKTALFAGVAAVVVLAAVGGPYYAGHVTEKALENRHQRLAEEYQNTFEITDRHYERGFFSSTDTFKLKVVPGTLPPDSDMELSEITISAKIQHGPILWAHGIGLAWADVSFKFPEDVQANLSRLFGGKSPLTVGAKIGFKDSVRFFAQSPATEYSDDKGSAKWGGANLTLDLTDYSEHIAYDLSVPFFEFNDKATGGQIAFTNLTSKGDVEQLDPKLSPLSFGDVGMKVDKIVVKDPDSDVNWQTNNLVYTVTTLLNGDSVDMNLNLTASEFLDYADDDKKIKLGKLDMALGFRHLHAQSLAKLYDAINKASQMKDFDPEVLNNASDTLLKSNPEIAVDRLTLDTDKGPVDMTAKMTLSVPKETPLGPINMFSMFALVDKIHLVGKASLPAELLDEMSGKEKTAEDLVNKGYFVRDGKLIKTEIEGKDGQLLLNGHPLQ